MTNETTPSPLGVVIVGAGDRGTTYARYAHLHPSRMKVVAVVDPDTARAASLGADHKRVGRRR